MLLEGRFISRTYSFLLSNFNLSSRVISNTLWFLAKSSRIIVSKFKPYFCSTCFSPLLSQLLEINNMGRWDGSRSMVLKASKSSGTTSFPLWLCRLLFLGMARLLFRTRLPLLWNTHWSEEEHWKRGYWSGAKKHNKLWSGSESFFDKRFTTSTFVQPFLSLRHHHRSCLHWKRTVIFELPKHDETSLRQVMKDTNHIYDKQWIKLSLTINM